MLLSVLVWQNVAVASGSVSIQAATETQNSDNAQLVDVFAFKNAQDQHRADYLARQLRCPRCQNQNLTESNASIARDMRLQVYKMVDQGHSNEDILNFMTDRFGEFVLYKPKFEASTYVLWLTPLMLLLMLIVAARSYTRKKSALNK
ncbi:heme lyase NrfEFG subunit NrfF [Vibrio sp. S11_S32]|uniref:Formate-dependent nitrite reductase complex subunit n=2 Tax=Vibrionaceae TaxID=641 RepID=A0A5Q0TFS7_9VIBR|nr:heme lyase NrfEFG subunit NrfF [Vibrio sp. S11_S32]